MAIRWHDERVDVDVPNLEAAELSTIGLTEKQLRQARFIVAVDGSGRGKVLKDGEGPLGIMPMADITTHWETMARARQRASAISTNDLERERARTIRMPSSLLRITRRGDL